LATTRANPPVKPDLADLKARLGLQKSLEKKQDEPDFGPGESTNLMSPEGFAPPSGSQPAMERMPESFAPRPMPGMGGGLPPMADGYAPRGAPGMGAPMGGPPMGGPGMGAPVGGPGRPPFAGPPGGMRPPVKAAPPKPKEPEWSPPPSDPSAGADVPIKAPLNLGKILGYVAVTGVITVFCAGLAFWFGQGVQQRTLYKAQTEDAKRIMELIQPRVEKVQKITAAVNKSDGSKPDAALMKELETVDFVLAPTDLVQNNLLFGPERTSLVVQFSADTTMLSKMLQRHVSLTTKVDKKELEDLAARDKDMNSAGFAILFNGQGYADRRTDKDKENDYILDKANIVVYDDPAPIEKDGEKFVKVRFPSTGKEFDAPLKDLMILEKTELTRSGGPNALIRYQQRHAEIKTKVQEMSQYSDTMLTKFNELSTRGPAPLINF
jgi:hypothetical protein